MEIEYNLTEDDYLQFNIFHLKHSKTAARVLIILRLTGPVIFLLAAYFFPTIDNLSFPVLLTIFIFLSVVWFLFYPKYYYNFIKRHTLKMIREGKNEGLLGKHWLTMSENDLVETSVVNELKVPWSGIQEFKEDDNYFYLYNSAISTFIIPKRELNDIAEVKNYLQERLQL